MSLDRHRESPTRTHAHADCAKGLPLALHATDYYDPMESSPRTRRPADGGDPPDSTRMTDGRAREIDPESEPADVAALRAQVAELRARLAESQRAAEQRTRLVGHVSHEFRTPLSSIIGFTSLLAADHRALADETRAEYLGIVLRNARHLLHVVNDILNLSKVDAGTLEVTLAPLRAGDVARAVAASMEPAAAERDIRVTVRDDARHLALADAGRLRQVLLNLLDNALKYSPAGTPVEIHVSSGGGEVRAEVADRGPGVRPEDRARLFKEFSRISHGLRIAGAGLGLALAKQLTEAMGGRIGVDSRPAGGSVFWVALPASVQAPAASGAVGGEPTIWEKARHGVVAVVDDDPDLRAYAAAVLEGAGYTVVLDDGSEGAAGRIAAARPALVLLDLNLGPRRGADVLAELRARPEAAGVPVAAFTASAGAAYAEQARAAGFDAHVVKPVEPDALLAHADALIALRSQRGTRPEAAAAPPPSPAPASADGELDDDYLAPLRGRFVAGLGERLRAMDEAVEAGDRETLSREAHKLRGAAAGFGLGELSVLAAAAEEALRAPGTPLTHPAVEALRARLRSDTASSR